MTPSSTTKLTLKLLIDTKNEKVLFAEASKPVVDFIFNILSLPVGTIVKLLGNNNGMVGSIGNLYQSVENLNHNYIQQDQNKDVLLNPSAPGWSIEIANRLPPQEEPLKTLSATSSVILEDELDNEDQEEDDDYNEDEDDDEDDDEDEDEEDNDYSEDDDDEDDDENEDEEEELEESVENNLGGETLFYVCPNECSYDVTCDKTTLCSSCKRAMNNKINYVGEKYISIKNGFVTDLVTFIVMDDLVIQPMSALSGIAILIKFNIKEIGTLKEMVVELGVDEGIKLLKASLQSKMVLTSVFLKKEY
ncbi:hypothetical protein QL285_006151 [Trifolium repens]|nr:hypothetical protein QL285_006151 [Trifolium repens]